MSSGENNYEIDDAYRIIFDVISVARDSSNYYILFKDELDKVEKWVLIDRRGAWFIITGLVKMIVRHDVDVVKKKLFK